MHVLLVGGSGFLSSAIVTELLLQKHVVSTFQRKGTGRDNVEEILVDISDVELVAEAIKGCSWDCVIDVDPTVKPNIVRSLTKLLKEHGVQHYTFISSIGAYKDFSKGPTETSPLHDPIEESPLSGSTFGGLKVASEIAVQAEMEVDNCLLIRPGLIIGPSDRSGRFTSWVERFSRNDDLPVVVPEESEWPTQAIDVQDLASWIVSMVEAKESGIYNATIDYTFGEVMEALQSVSEKRKELYYIPHIKLIEAGITPYSQLPLWVPPSLRGLVTADCQKAQKSGLRAKPLSETVQSIHKWRTTLSEEEHKELMKKFYSSVGVIPELGLTKEKEEEFIKQQTC